KKEDGRIQWSRTARQIYNRMRGFTPWPGAFCSFREQTCHIWGRPGTAPASGGQLAPGEIILFGKEVFVASGEGTLLRLEFVQLEGRKRVTAKEFANGARLVAGDRFV
ncbi:MAG: methionyl-tRNA formyltransferase, partial [Candidatus Acidiferrales bacterium]